MSESHDGSGFIVSTGTGSTAWYLSILGDEAVFHVHLINWLEKP
jgi:hypothetical protein